jgi:hypothetical protein
MDTSDIGKIGSYCERNNAAGPTKSIPGDDDACSCAARIVVDLSDQLLRFGGSYKKLLVIASITSQRPESDFHVFARAATNEFDRQVSRACR